MADEKDLASQRRLEKGIQYVRLFMQDNATLNRLIRQEEFTDQQITLAAMLTIDDYNITTPVTNLSIASYPSLWFFIHGTVLQLLKMGGILQSRNEFNYSSGGLTVRVSDKTQLYQSWIQAFLAEYLQKLRNYKMYMNIEQMYGNSVFSEYYALGWYW